MTDSQIHNAEYLLSILTEMGNQKTSPVLLALPDPSHIELNHKYHLEAILIKDCTLKVFYHCHSYPDKDIGEHGHFHIFLQTKHQSEWKHLTALSMDKSGQVIQWVTVNKWVTDSSWVSEVELSSLLNDIADLSPDNLLHAWLVALIKLYKQSLDRLIVERDYQLIKIKNNNHNSDIFSNRDIYQFSHSNINLEKTLTTILSPQYTS